VGAKDAYWLTGLYQQGLIALKPLERRNDPVKTFPVACCPADAAIDHELTGLLGDIGVEIVHQHPHGCFREPALC
jgi:hypothetical protein